MPAGKQPAPGARSSALRCVDNPGGRREYVVSLSGRVGLGAASAARDASVSVRYVPAGLLLVPETLNAYLDAVGRVSWATLEAAALAVVDDMFATLSPRWVQVVMTASGTPHEVVAEERQPRWDNAHLTSRLRPY